MKPFKIDHKVRKTIHPEIYAECVFKQTHDKTSASKAERNVILAARYILYLDDYYETKNRLYLKKAKNALNVLLGNLTKKQIDRFKKIHAIVGTFFDYEACITKRKPVTTALGRRLYLMKKSSDVFLYSIVSGVQDQCPKKTTAALHYLQQLNDLYDDLTDTREDAANESPNLVFLFSWKYKNPQDLSLTERSEVKKVATVLLEKIHRSVPHIPQLIRLAQKYRENILRMLK